MADNSLQTGSDSIRDIDRSGAGPKTQVFQLDHGGSGASESLTSKTNPLPVYDPDTIASGTIAALNATVAVALNADSAMRVQITGTWVGTLQFEATVDGTTWVPINAVQAGSTIIPQNTTTNGTFSPTPSGFASFRVNATAWNSGTATVSIRTSSGAGGVYLNQYLPAFSVIPAFKIDQTAPGITNAVAVSNIPTAETLLGQILVELMVHSTLLQIGLSVRDDPADLRADFLQILN